MPSMYSSCDILIRNIKVKIFLLVQTQHLNDAVQLATKVRVERRESFFNINQIVPVFGLIESKIITDTG